MLDRAHVSHPESPFAPSGVTSRSEVQREIVYGFAWLATALFLFVWSGFDLAILLAGVVPILTGGGLFRSIIGADGAELAPMRSHCLPFDVALARWRLAGLVGLLGVLIVLALARIAALSGGESSSVAGSDAERWLPLLLSASIPIWFLLSGVIHRVPRHLVVGLVALAGAVAGPLLGIAWRDSLALAAAVLGVALIVVNHRRSAPVTPPGS